MLIAAVGRVQVGQLLVKASLDLRDPFRTAARDWARLLVADRLQAAAAFAMPRPPALRTGHKPLRDELQLNALDDLLARSHRRLPFGLHPLPGRRQRLPPLLTGPQMRRRLIATPTAVTLVLLTIGLLSLIEDLLHDRLITTVAIQRRVGQHLGAVDRDLPKADQPRLRTERQHLAQPVLMAAPKLRDRRVIRDLKGGDDLERDVAAARPLDLPRGPDPQAKRVEQQSNHHRRVIRRPALTIGSILAIKPVEVHLINRPQHRPDEVIVFQPIRQRRRQKHHLAAVTSHEVLSHPQMVLNRPDATA